MAAAIVLAGAGLVPPPPGPTLLVAPGLSLASAASFFGLGLLARRGEGWAALALMALLTAWLAAPNLAAWRAHSQGPSGFAMGRALVCLAAWALWMRVFHAAYRTRRRAARPGADA